MSRYSGLLDVYTLEEYGPMDAALGGSGPLRPSFVRYAQGVQNDPPNTQYLVYSQSNTPYYTTKTVPLALAGNFRITQTPSSSPSSIGSLTSTVSGAPLAGLVYTSTGITALSGSVSATVAAPLAVGSVVSFVLSETNTQLSLYASVDGGSIASSLQTISVPVSAGYRTLTIGQFGNTTPVAGAALEAFTVYKGTLSALDAARIIFSGNCPSYNTDPRIVFSALTTELDGLFGMEDGGTGYLAIRNLNNTSGYFRATSVNALEDNSAYVDNGVSVVAIMPYAASNFYVGQYIQLEDSSLYTIDSISDEGTSCEIYLKPYNNATHMIISPGGYNSGYTSNY